MCNQQFLDNLSVILKSGILNNLNFGYYTEDEFNRSSISCRSKFSVFHVNIRSLNKNHWQLTNFLSQLRISFDVIVLSEIWNYNLEFYNNLFDGYKFVYITPETSLVGGVGMYIKNEYSFTILDKFRIPSSNANRVDNLWVEIYDNKFKCIIGGIYRHPNQNFDDFSKLLEPILNVISSNDVRTVHHCWRPKY